MTRPPRDPAHRLPLALVALGLALALPAAAAPDPGWRPVETVRYGAAGQAFSLIVESDTASDDSPRLKVVDPHGRASIISLDGGLVTAAEGLANTGLAAANRLRSKYLYASNALKDRAGDQLVVVFGEAMASDPGSLRVLHLGAGGKAEILLSDDTFQLEHITDLDHDGVAELIGHRSLSQMSGHCLTTYDPVSVFRLGAGPGARFAYAADLSKAYNLSHRYVWAGPDAREDVAVDICRKAGPRLVPAPHPD